jgi:hypothetical protein
MAYTAADQCDFSSMSQAEQYLDSVATRLSNGGLTVQRKVQSEKYLFGFIAANPPVQFYRGRTRNEWVIVASLIEVESPSQAADFSSFVMKYVRDNKRELHVGGSDLSTISLMVAQSLGDEVKKWVSETTPNRSIISDRFEFPVLVEVQSRQFFYFRKKQFVAAVEYEDLREFVDKYLGFQT